MSDFQLSDKLLSTPLFLGLSRSDMHDIVGTTKFGFEKFAKGATIAKAGAPCTSLVFLLNGTMEVTTTSSDRSYSVTELLHAPMQLQSERLFGLHQIYTSTFKAATTCSTMALAKSEVMNLCSNYATIRINILNIYAARLQKAEDRNWAACQQTLRMRIIIFFARHSLHPAGEKHFKIKMKDLAKEMNDSRLNISIELNKLQDEGMLNLSRGMIHIPALERMFF